jgi:transposase
MKETVDRGHIYLFFGKNRKRLKAIYFDGTGLVLVSKRLERGSFMSIAELNEKREISLSDLKLIFHGSTIRRPILNRKIVANSSGKNIAFTR